MNEEEDELINGFSPDSQLVAKIQGLQIYLLQSDPGACERRLMLLYPVDCTVEQHFYSQKNLCINDLSLSMVEMELSFKQAFCLLLMGSKIVEAFKPVT